MFDSAWDMMVKIALRMITLITLATQLETWWWRSANDFDFMRPIMELGVTLVTIHPAMAKKIAYNLLIFSHQVSGNERVETCP